MDEDKPKNNKRMKELMHKFKIDTAKERATGTLHEISESRMAISAKEKIRKAKDQGSTFVAEGYEKTGTKKVFDWAGETFDEVSGKAILEEVKKLVQTQALYNDVLATKLQEALERIATLEAQVKKS